MVCQHGKPRMVLIWCLIDSLYLPFQPIKRFRQRHQKGVQPLGHVPYFILFKGVGKQLKILVFAFQQFIHGVAES